MYPSLYEINTRPWLKQFGISSTLADIPVQYWSDLKDKGIDYIWLMGIWETSQSSIALHCFHPDLVKAYNRVNKNWTSDDITGSPYAIEDYTLASSLGTEDELRFLKDQLNALGLGLILDFIPNHFNSHSRLVSEKPEIFLKKEDFQDTYDRSLYFKQNDQLFVHGKDPYFPAWSDTVQIDYFNSEAHDFMLQRLMKVASLCDGVRCDMAMLILPDIFGQTWSFLADAQIPANFWADAIPAIKNMHPDFLFLGEAYWDTQWRLQQLGFDYTYDKRVLDLFKEGNIQELKLHLSATLDYQDKCLRFIENHDEERSLLSLGDDRAKAAAILFTTIPGMKLHYDGQWHGHRIKYPVQMGTFFKPDPCLCAIKSSLSSSALPCGCISAHYDQLLKVLNHPVFKKGAWQMLQGEAEQCIGFRWRYKGEERIVVINLGADLLQCHFNLSSESLNGDVVDLLNREKNPGYVTRDSDGGLGLKLPGFKGCILAVGDSF